MYNKGGNIERKKRLLTPESEGVKMSIKEDKTLNKAYEKLEEISNDKYLREIEELKWKAISDEKSMREGAYEEGMQKGKQQGLKEEIQLGKHNGEKNKSKEIAKKLLNKGVKEDEVSDITGLTIEEIKKL